MLRIQPAFGVPLLTAAIFISGCSTTQTKKPDDPLATPLVEKPAKKEIDTYIEEVDQGFDKTDSEPTADEGEQTSKPTDNKASSSNSIPEVKSTEIPMEMNKAVRDWIRYFAEKDTERFQRFLERGERYRKQISETLKEYQVPEEIYYLAMIESGFATKAHSHAAAVGVWQFIKGTGQRYGLRIDAYVDERMDPVKSTEAAARYLRDLYNVYQSWYLAMASYNAGEARILNAIMKANTRDFWQLASRKALPDETLNYVPKFIAATIIGHHPEHFGFKVPKSSDYPELIPVSIPSRIRLNDVATTLGMTYPELRQYNPSLKTGWVPNDKSGSWTIWIPKSLEETYASKADAIAELPKGSLPAGMAEQDNSRHKVRSGETLPSIAHRYGVSIADLRRWNNLPNNRIRRGQTLVVDGSEVQATSSAPSVHVVKRGENLASISEKYNVPVSAIKKVNNLKKNALQAGQKLKITAKLPTEEKSQKYKVRQGDSLEKIASQFGVTVQQLKKINRMNRNRVYAGQILRVNEN